MNNSSVYVRSSSNPVGEVAGKTLSGSDTTPTISINVGRYGEAMRDILEEYDWFDNLKESLKNKKDAYEFAAALRNCSSFNIEKYKVYAYFIKSYSLKIVYMAKNILEEEKEKNEKAKDTITDNFDKTLVPDLHKVCDKNIHNYNDLLQSIYDIIKHKDEITVHTLTSQVSSVMKSCRDDIPDKVHNTICYLSASILAECYNAVESTLVNMNFNI